MQQVSNQFEVGRRIHYPGDIANPAADGVIVRQYRDAWGERFDAILFDGRTFSGLSPQRFSGLRPWRLLDRLHSVAMIEACQRRAAARAAQEATERALGASRLEAERQRLIALHPELTPISIGTRRTIGDNIRATFRVEGFRGARVRAHRGSSGYTITLPADTSEESFRIAQSLGARYELGSFNGMTDSYEYQRTAWTDTFGGVRFVFVNRESRPQ